LINGDPSGEIPLLVSDELPHYETVLLESHHEVIVPPPDRQGRTAPQADDRPRRRNELCDRQQGAQGRQGEQRV
jgi:hypothetical protein